jgi:hypothetical protein
MDTVLITVAALSLAMAIGMAIVVAKLLRDDRARSEARVAALSAMAASTPTRTKRAPGAAAEPVPAVEIAHAHRTVPPGPSVPAYEPPVVPLRSVPVTPSPGTIARAPQLDDLEIRPAAAMRAELFAESDRPSPWGRRLAVIGVLVVGIAVVGFAMTAARTDRTASAPASLSATNDPAAENPPLELLSLRHAQQAQSLVITGLVRNPRGGAPLSRVVASAFVFGPDGTFLASNRASLDFMTIAPGDESPFVVTVPVTGDVSRYRIGFRTEDGHVIAHVDKRAPDALASTSAK